MEENRTRTLRDMESKHQKHQDKQTEEMEDTHASHVAVLDKLHGEVIELGHATQQILEASEHALREWAKQWRAELDSAGTGGGGGSQKRDYAIDPAKDIPILALKDGASKADFIQWRETLDLSLECIQGYEDAEDILSHVRRSDEEITSDQFNVIKTTLIAARSKRNTWAWDFETISRVMYKLIVPKLNTKLNQMCHLIKGRNG